MQVIFVTSFDRSGSNEMRAFLTTLNRLSLRFFWVILFVISFLEIDRLHSPAVSSFAAVIALLGLALRWGWAIPYMLVAIVLCGPFFSAESVVVACVFAILGLGVGMAADEFWAAISKESPIGQTGNLPKPD